MLILEGCNPQFDNSVVNMHHSSYHPQPHSIIVNKIHGTEQERREPWMRYWQQDS